MTFRAVVMATLGLLGLSRVAAAGTLALSCELLSSGPNPACPSSAPPYTVPGQYDYANSLTAPAGATPIQGSNIYGGPKYGNLGPAGFIDDYFFNIQPAEADVVSATINLNGQYSASNLFARIYTLAANPGGLVKTTPNGTVDYATVTNSGSLTIVQIDGAMLAAGSYVLEISGTDAGTIGGGYVGKLNLNPVPLPDSFSLLAVGAVALAGWLFLARTRRSADG